MLNYQLMEKHLITIIVVTYNSSTYVLDALNSISSSNYKNLQIIISDDYSTDDTIPKCQEWINKYSSVYDILLLKADTNKGTAFNINKALPYVKGDFVKIIAGDDEFCDNYFSVFMDYFANNPDCNILSTNVKYIYENKGYVSDNKSFTSYIHTNQLDTIEMYRTIIRYNCIFSPTCIIKSTLFHSIGGFDERFPLCEDLFFYAKVLKNGNRIHFINECLIKYRIHDKSVQSRNTNIVFTRYDQDYMLGKKELLWEDMGLCEKRLEKCIYCNYRKILLNGNDYRLSNRFRISNIALCNFILKVIRFRYYLNIANH